MSTTNPMSLTTDELIAGGAEHMQEILRRLSNPNLRAKNRRKLHQHLKVHEGVTVLTVTVTSPSKSQAKKASPKKSKAFTPKKSTRIKPATAEDARKKAAQKAFTDAFAKAADGTKRATGRAAFKQAMGGELTSEQAELLAAIQ